MIYVVTFLLSLLFFGIALNFRKKRKILFVIFSGIALFIPSYLAGVRDISIGTDVKVYILPLFIGAGWFTSFFKFVLYKNSSISDLLYLLLTYVCRLITDDQFLLFFLITFISMLVVYIALLIDNNDEKRTTKEQNSSILLGMLLYFTFFYNSTFNMARQSIALSFIILAFSYLRKNKKKSCYISILIACLFHKTALFSIPFVVIYNRMQREKTINKRKKMSDLFLIILCAVFVIISPFIFNLLANFKFLGNIMQFYTIWGNVHDFNFSNTIFYLIIFFIVTLCAGRLSKDIKDYRYYKLVSIISVILLQLGVVAKFMDRIVFYIFYPLIYLVIAKLSITKAKTEKELFCSIFIYVLFILYWVYWIVILGYHDTYPFIFR